MLNRRMQIPPEYYLSITSHAVILYSAQHIIINEWNFEKPIKNLWWDENNKDDPWVDCRLGKLLIVEWSNTGFPRRYTVWDIFTKEMITIVNLFYIFPRQEKIRAWITKDGVAITCGPTSDVGVSWSYIPFKTNFLNVEPVQTFFGCWITYVVVDDEGSVLLIYDNFSLSLYVYDLNVSPIRGIVHKVGPLCKPKFVKRLNEKFQITLVSNEDLISEQFIIL